MSNRTQTTADPDIRRLLGRRERSSRAARLAQLTCGVFLSSYDPGAPSSRSRTSPRLQTSDSRSGACRLPAGSRRLPPRWIGKKRWRPNGDTEPMHCRLPPPPPPQPGLVTAGTTADTTPSEREDGAAWVCFSSRFSLRSRLPGQIPVASSGGFYGKDVHSFSEAPSKAPDLTCFCAIQLTE